MTQAEIFPWQGNESFIQVVFSCQLTASASNSPRGKSDRRPNETHRYLELYYGFLGLG